MKIWFTWEFRVLPDGTCQQKCLAQKEGGEIVISWAEVSHIS